MDLTDEKAREWVKRLLKRFFDQGWLGAETRHDERRRPKEFVRVGQRPENEDFSEAGSGFPEY